MVLIYQVEFRMQQNIAQKCWRILTDKTKKCLKNRAARIIARKFASKDRASRIIARTFAWNETIGVTKFRRFIAAISQWAKFRRKAGKSQEIRRNWLALLLHNTVVHQHGCYPIVTWMSRDWLHMLHTYIICCMICQHCCSQLSLTGILTINTKIEDKAVIFTQNC